MANEKPNWYQNKVNYVNDYQKNNTKKVGLILNKNTDADIIQHLETIDNKAGYIKQLIRDDIAKKQ